MNMASAVSDIRRLYKAVRRGEMISGLIGNDLEWWFHGPQECHYMMKKLTGKSSARDMEFEPENIEVVDEHVIVEGWEAEEEEIYWVHVWTMKDGVISEFREYFNTSLTVRDVRPLVSCSAAPLWQSHPRAHHQLPGRSMPGLMLAL